MGLHRRLFGSSNLKLRSANSIIMNPFRRNLHQNPNPNPKFLVKRLYGNMDSRGGDAYLSVLSTTGVAGGKPPISPEKSFYFRSPRAQPACPFALFGGEDNDNNSSLSLSPPFKLGLVSSCNGLICIDAHYRPEQAVVWNPLINEFKIIGYSSIPCPKGVADTDFECAGFGFDRESKDHKIVARASNHYEHRDEYGTEYYEGTEFQYHVYSLKNGCWRPLRSPSEWFPSCSSCSSVYIDGFYYWKASPSNGNAPDNVAILCFDFAKEAFRCFFGPDTGKPREPYDYTLVDSGGVLCFVHYPLCGIEKKFALWVWEKEGWAWKKGDDFCVSGAEKPLACWNMGDCWLFEGINRELLLLDRTVNKLHPLGIYDFPDEMELVPFVESMTRPHGEDETMTEDATSTDKGSGIGPFEVTNDVPEICQECQDKKEA